MSFGSKTPRGNPGSFDGGQFEYFDGDPSVDGLARPIGWRVGHADGTAAWDKTGPLDTDWTPVGGASGAPSGAGALIERSASFMPPGFAADFDDFTSNTLVDWSASGGIVNVTTRGPGVWSFPNTNFALLQKQSISVVNAAVTPWHLAGRIKFGTATAAGDREGMLLGTGAFSNFVAVGRYQAASATHFVFTLCKALAFTQVPSTVPIDTTNFHTVELWFDGTNVYGSVDDETPVLVGTAANCPAALALNPLHGVVVTGSDGGGGVAMFIDFAYTAAGRTAT